MSELLSRHTRLSNATFLQIYARITTRGGRGGFLLPLWKNNKRLQPVRDGFFISFCERSLCRSSWTGSHRRDFTTMQISLSDSCRSWLNRVLFLKDSESSDRVRTQQISLQRRNIKSSIFSHFILARHAPRVWIHNRLSTQTVIGVSRQRRLISSYQPKHNPQFSSPDVWEQSRRTALHQKKKTLMKLVLQQHDMRFWSLFLESNQQSGYDNLTCRMECFPKSVGFTLHVLLRDSL